MSTLAVQEVSVSGLEATFASAAAGGDEFVNTGDILLWVKNGATDCDVTITTQQSSLTVKGYGEIALSNQTVTVTANEERLIGPFPTIRWNDANSKVQITYDDVSNVTVAAVKAQAV